MSAAKRDRATDMVAEHRRQVGDADQKWREQGQADSGGSSEGWGLPESEGQR